MCNCGNNFVGDTPYLNRPLHAYNGVKSNFSLPSLEYKQAAGVAVDAGYGVQADKEAAAAGQTPVKRDWLGTALPILDSLLEVKRTPAEDSAFDVNTTPREDNSVKILIWVGVGVAVLVAAYFIIKRKK